MSGRRIATRSMMTIRALDKRSFVTRRWGSGNKWKSASERGCVGSLICHVRPFACWELCCVQVSLILTCSVLRLMPS